MFTMAVLHTEDSLSSAESIKQILMKFWDYRRKEEMPLFTGLKLYLLIFRGTAILSSPRAAIFLLTISFIPKEVDEIKWKGLSFSPKLAPYDPFHQFDKANIQTSITV